MPYCPKCDMEFVEGITHCSDCGGELVASRDVWKAEELVRQEKQRREAQEQLRRMREQMEEEGFDEEAAPAGEASPSGKKAAIMPDRARRGAARPVSTVFVPARQRAKDLRSSRSAFFLVGAAALAAGALGFAGVLTLPMNDQSRLLMNVVLAGIGVIFLYIGVRTQGTIAKALEEADREEARTAEILASFREKWQPKAIDRRIFRDEPGLMYGSEVLDLRRSSLISDILITNYDLPNPRYVDYLTDQLMTEYYQEAE